MCVYIYICVCVCVCVCVCECVCVVSSVPLMKCLYAYCGVFTNSYLMFHFILVHYTLFTGSYATDVQFQMDTVMGVSTSSSLN